MKMHLTVLFLALTAIFSLWAKAADQPGCLRVKHVKSSPRAIPQGGLARLDLELKAEGCKLAFAGPSIRETVEGLTVPEPSPFRVTGGSTAYGSERGLVAPQPTPARKLAYVLRVAPAADAPLGPQTMNAVVRYQQFDQVGNLSWHEQAISIPLHVVPVGEPMPHPDPWWQTALLIALLPVALVIYMVTGVAIISD